MVLRSALFATTVFILFNAAHAGDMTSSDEEVMPSLGLTRSAFFVRLAMGFPSVEIPTLQCGKPIVLRQCWSSKTNGIVVSAADTIDVMSDENIQRFSHGGEGLLYEAAVTATIDGQLDTMHRFTNFCAALFATARPGLKKDDARKLVANGLGEAMLNRNADGGEWSDYDQSAILIITFRSTTTAVSCKIASQHIVGNKQLDVRRQLE